jgi:serine/threonine protein kinase
MSGIVMQITSITATSSEALSLDMLASVIMVDPLNLDESGEYILSEIMCRKFAGRCYVAGKYVVTTDDDQEFIIELAQTIGIKESKHEKISAKIFDFNEAPVAQNTTTMMLAALGKTFFDEHGELHFKDDNKNKIYKKKEYKVDDIPEYEAVKDYLKVIDIQHIDARKPLWGMYADNSGLSLFPMRRIPGKNLLQLIIAQPDLTVADRFEISIAIFKALQEQVIQYGKIHRDIKPENMMAYQQDNHWVIEIIDYDYSTDMNNKDDSHPGTFEYAAPEMLAEQDYDHRVDIYSAAISVNDVWLGHEMHNELRHLLTECASHQADLRPDVSKCISRLEKAYANYQQPIQYN